MSHFRTKTNLRSFEIYLGNGSDIIFINHFWLAELSPYFANLCFGEFTEARAGKASIEGVETEDLLAMLEYLCPDQNHQLNRTINDSNLAALIHCANRFQIPSLAKDLEVFIQDDLKDCHKPEALVDSIVEAQIAEYRPSLMRHLYSKLGQHGEKTVLEAVKDLPSDMSRELLEEVKKYYPVITVPTKNSSFRWNEFERRMFF